MCIWISRKQSKNDTNPDPKTQIIAITRKDDRPGKPHKKYLLGGGKKSLPWCGVSVPLTRHNAGHGREVSSGDGPHPCLYGWERGWERGFRDPLFEKRGPTPLSGSLSCFPSKKNPKGEVGGETNPPRLSSWSLEAYKRDHASSERRVYGRGAMVWPAGGNWGRWGVRNQNQ